jgi:DNA polymerase-1
VFYDDWGIKHAMQNRPATPTMRHPKRSVDDAAREEILQERFTFKGAMVTERKGNMVSQVEAPDFAERKEHIKSFVTRYHRFQKVQKQASTYILSLIERAEQDEDSRIYTQLNLHGTNSGRLSSSRPNLQNITREKEDLPHIRKLFHAPSGFTIVQADFSQAELRCIAAFSGDSLLSKIYTDGLDLHDETARRFFGEDFTKEQRSTCKNVNFGVFYRQGADTFQQKHGIDAVRAQAYIDWVWTTFTGVGEWELGIEQEIRKRGVLVSPFGRKRRFHLLTRENVQAAFREGINFYPQSCASDLTLCSAIGVEAQTDRSRCAIINLVHDSIVAEVEDSYVDEYKTICKQIMESSAKDELGWTLPFIADITSGPTWGDCV